MVVNDWVDRFAVWDGFHPDLQTLLIYGAGIALYSALVFAFYQNISVRDPLHSKARKGWWGKALHVTETALTFPVLSFGYFTVISLALFLLAKPERATADILLLSMACVLGVRVTAHLSEGMSNDIAKLLPLGLLAVVVVDPGHLTIAGAFARIAEAFWMMPTLVQYFALFIIVEAALRGVRALFPGLSRFAHRMEQRRTLSKRAMLRDVAAEHGSHHFLPRREHHAHGPRDRTGEFVSLDERTGGKPGSRQGVGPAIRPELQRAAPTPARGHRPTPRAGPGGSGGRLGVPPDRARSS